MGKSDTSKRNQLDISLLSTYRAEIYGIAILWIMLFHGGLVKVSYFRNVPGLSVVGRLLECGNMGVEVFLFLSGISLYFSLKREPDLHRYICKRLKKLLPPLWVMVGVYAVIVHFLDGQSGGMLLLKMTAVKFWLDGDQHVWFISLMLVLYILYPYIYYFLYQDDEDILILLRTVFLTGVAMVFVYLCSRYAKTAYDQVEIALTRLPVFLLGCGCGKAVYEKKKYSVLWWIPICLLTIFCFHVLDSGELHGIWRRWFYLVGGIPLTFLLAQAAKFLPKGCRKALQFPGKFSLELYIAHLTLMRLYTKNLFFYPYVPGSAWRWLVLLVISGIAAYLTNFLLERLYRIGKDNGQQKKIIQL